MITLYMAVYQQWFKSSKYRSLKYFIVDFRKIRTCLSQISLVVEFSSSRTLLPNRQGGKAAGQKKAPDPVLASTSLRLPARQRAVFPHSTLLMDLDSVERVYLSVHIWARSCESTRLERASLSGAPLHLSSSASKVIIDMVNTSATGGHCLPAGPSMTRGCGPFITPCESLYVWSTAQHGDSH